MYKTTILGKIGIKKLKYLIKIFDKFYSIIRQEIEELRPNSIFIAR